MSDTTPLDELDKDLTLMLIAGEGPRLHPRGTVSEGCVQIRLDKLREIRDTLRNLRAALADIVGLVPVRDERDPRAHKPSVRAVRERVESARRILNDGGAGARLES